MNKNLKEVQKELEAKKREANELETQVRKLKATPKAERFVKAFLTSDEVCEELVNFTNTEIDVIAKELVASFHMIVTTSQGKLEEVRKKNAAKTARRKQKETAKSSVDVSASADTVGGYNHGV